MRLLTYSLFRLECCYCSNYAGNFKDQNQVLSYYLLFNTNIVISTQAEYVAIKNEAK